MVFTIEDIPVICMASMLSRSNIGVRSSHRHQGRRAASRGSRSSQVYFISGRLRPRSPDRYSARLSVRLRTKDAPSGLQKKTRCWGWCRPAATTDRSAARGDDKRGSTMKVLLGYDSMSLHICHPAEPPRSLSGAVVLHGGFARTARNAYWLMTGQPVVKLSVSVNR